MDTHSVGNSNGGTGNHMEYSYDHHNTYMAAQAQAQAQAHAQAAATSESAGSAAGPRHSLSAGATRTSWVWQFFHRLAEDRDKAVCHVVVPSANGGSSICGKAFKCGGQSGTSHLGRHLSAKHSLSPAGSGAISNGVHDDSSNSSPPPHQLPHIVPRVLTVAGSDSGGGAGVQADLKTLNSLSVYGSSVLTALTAQNTLGVQGVFPVPAEFVEQQLRSVLDDIGCDAAKTGMLYDALVIETVARLFKQYNVRHIVVDPVMVSTSGSRLLAPAAVTALYTHLLPLAELLTPNVPEAEVLANMKIQCIADVRAAAQKLHSLGCAAVLIKGGHLPIDANEQPVDPTNMDLLSNAYCVDTLFDGREFTRFVNPYLVTRSTHGTGCTLSSAIAAALAKGLDLKAATEEGLAFVHRGIQSAFPLGNGAGPLNHFPPPPQLPPPQPRRISFVSTLKAHCANEWRAYVYHPFVNQLADGTLPLECFKHFIRQDYIFLKQYARANALASYREHELEQVVKAAAIVAYIGEEVQMHVKFCKDWGITLEELEGTSEAKPNLAYTRYVLEKGMSGDRLDLRVALAPCLLGYGEIGRRLYNDPHTKREDNPYWSWIQNYAKPEFQAAVVEGEALLELLFEEMVPVNNTRRLGQLCDTFRQATILEEHFWQMGLALLD
ncbi:hypothetical protein HDU86_001150 [Geranomyces michiganensis]|nr:hypothetical protein HDU86_001150 [Geranomyces michiganensis]